MKYAASLAFMPRDCARNVIKHNIGKKTKISLGNNINDIIEIIENISSNNKRNIAKNIRNNGLSIYEKIKNILKNKGYNIGLKIRNSCRNKTENVYDLLSSVNFCPYTTTNVHRKVTSTTIPAMTTQTQRHI